MPHVDVTVYYLEMRTPSQRTVSPPREGLTVVQAKRPTLAFYRFLYRTVGQDYHWSSRGKLPDADLARVLADPRNELYVLYDNGTPAGFAELDRPPGNEVEIAQFGLMPEFIGQGLGKYFLGWVLEKAWSYHPSRVWLHTCTLDHPAAVPNYQKAGLVIYRQQLIQREI